MNCFRSKPEQQVLALLHPAKKMIADMQKSLNTITAMALAETKATQKVNSNVLLDWKRSVREILQSAAITDNKADPDKTVMQQIDPIVGECDRVSQDMLTELQGQL